MSSPGQRRGTCGYVMASFDSHLVCACCRDKGKGKDPCVEKTDLDCPICLAFSPEQRLQLSTPSYKIKKEKREAKKLESYIWSHIPDIDSATNTSEDNPFAWPKTPVPGKVSVQMLTKDWLCMKLEKLNTTLVKGYPSRGSEAGGLAKDVFLRPAKSQSKWYGLFSDHKVDPSAVSSWCTDSSKLNSSYSRIARQSGLSSTPPASRRISQETLRRWERSAREATAIYATRQPASIRCLFIRFSKTCRIN